MGLVCIRNESGLKQEKPGEVVKCLKTPEHSRGAESRLIGNRYSTMFGYEKSTAEGLSQWLKE